jgi:hypothetical protein
MSSVYLRGYSVQKLLPESYGSCYVDVESKAYRRLQLINVVRAKSLAPKSSRKLFLSTFASEFFFTISKSCCYSVGIHQYRSTQTEDSIATLKRTHTHNRFVGSQSLHVAAVKELLTVGFRGQSCISSVGLIKRRTLGFGSCGNTLP